MFVKLYLFPIMYNYYRPNNVSKTVILLKKVIDFYISRKWKQDDKYLSNILMYYYKHVRYG